MNVDKKMEKDKNYEEVIVLHLILLILRLYFLVKNHKHMNQITQDFLFPIPS